MGSVLYNYFPVPRFLMIAPEAFHFSSAFKFRGPVFVSSEVGLFSLAMRGIRGLSFGTKYAMDASNGRALYFFAIPTAYYI